MNCENQSNIFLVPKFYLGMHLLEKFYFDSFLWNEKKTKYNFLDNCVPKCNLGTSKKIYSSC